MSDFEHGRVSVIVPCHDRVRPLRECLESVAKQTYDHLEVIVVDDASEEDIESVVQSIPYDANVRTRYLRSAENVGPGKARELGRQVATGEFIAYLDSDDLWQREKVSRQVAALRSDPSAGMCYCTTGEFTALPLPDDPPVRAGSDSRISSFLPHVLTDGRPWGTSSCLWSREATARIGAWYPGWTWEDYEYDCRAGCLDIQIIHVPEMLCFCRKNGPDEQLSDTDWPTLERRRIGATFEIIRHLAEHDKLNDRRIRERVHRMLFDRAVSLYSFGEVRLGTQSMAQIVSIGPLTQRIVQYAALVRLVSYLLPHSKVARVGRKLRRMLPNK